MTTKDTHDFGHGTVPAHQHENGGGWVANTAEVSPAAYVGQRAQVYGGAWVSGGAQVSGNARVYGDAQVSGNAQVYGGARVSGNARVYGGAWVASPLQIQGTRHHLTTCSGTEIAIGCESRTVDHWLAHYAEIGQRNGYSDAEIAEYGFLLRVAAEWLRNSPPAEVSP